MYVFAEFKHFLIEIIENPYDIKSDSVKNNISSIVLAPNSIRVE